MADIDVSIKRIMQIRPEDFAAFIVPGCKKEWIREINPEKVPKRESRMDKLLFIHSPEEEFILNIEPQAYYDKSMAARMLRYRADTWEYTLGENIGTPSIKQVVIYFFKKDDNKEYSLKDKWNDTETLKYSFKPIRIWETPTDLITEKKLIGLYPLLPLMQRQQTESDDDILRKTVEIINTVDNDSLRADLFAVTSILGEYTIATEIIKKYIRRNMLMNSPLFNEWVEEERKEAAEKATLEATEKASKKSAQKYIIDLLTEKFDFIPKALRESIETIDDIVVLEEIFRKTLKINTLEEFTALIEKAKKI